MSTEDMFEDDDILAAEYALGLLTGDELATARNRAATDRAFAGSVTYWETRFASLAEELEPVTPRAAVKAALMQRLFPDAAPQGFFSRLRLWQGVAATSLAVLGAVVLLQFGQPDQATGPLYTAEIASQEGDFRVIAVVDKSTDEIILTRTAGAAPAGRILQVWAHGEGAPATSVGLWPEGTTVRLPMPAEIAAVEGILTVGVSEEPPGGSPTGSPSGRVFGTVDIPNVTGGI